jgi:plastocyanin
MVVSDGSSAPPPTTGTSTSVPPTTAPPTTTPPTTAPPTTVAPDTTTTGAATTTTVTNQVTLIDLAFDPVTITVHAGDTVTWVNGDTTAHDVVADDASFDSGNLAPDASFQFTFPKAGTVAYHCSLHPQMKGTVVVQ